MPDPRGVVTLMVQEASNDNVRRVGGAPEADTLRDLVARFGGDTGMVMSGSRRRRPIKIGPCHGAAGARR